MIDQLTERYGEIARRGLRSLQEQEIAKLMILMRDNFTTGQVAAVLGCVELGIEELKAKEG